MASPIPIAPDHALPHAGHGGHAPLTSPSSLSPQTPFFPPPGMGGTPAQPGSLFKWAASFGRASPPVAGSAPGGGAGRGLGGSPSAGSVTPAIVKDDHDEHDSFEFGDFGGSWVKGRRAMSMSGSASGQSGIAAMMKNGGSPTESRGDAFVAGAAAGAGAGAGRLAGGGVMADKAAKGQGVLRRLSLSGAGYRPPFLSPPLTSSGLPPSPPSATPTNTLAAPPPPTPVGSVGDATIERSSALGAGHAAAAAAGMNKGRGRRYSEGVGKKRGVSPMGERILREHGHF
ncbi:hypothetical protein IAT38_003984 [Cryptococcus sp. DSM 104549]